MVETACRRAASRQRPLLDELLDTPPVVEALGAERVRTLLDPAGYLGSTQEFIERALQRHTKELL